MTEEKEEKEEQEVPKGYYIAEVPTAYGNIIAKEGKQIAVEELIIKMANTLEKAGLMK